MLFRWSVWFGVFASLLVSGCTPKNSTQNPDSSANSVPSAVSTPQTPSDSSPATSAAKSLPADDLGRPVALKGTAQRVIAIGPGAVETIFALGAQRQLVGRDDYADFPPDAKKVAIAGNYQGPNIEQCVALRPDLVILQGETWDKARLSDWQQKIGVPVAALSPTTVSEVAHDIEILGAWMGQQNAAKRLVAPWTALQSSNSKSAKTPKARLKVCIETGRSPLWVAGQGTLVSDAIAQGGFDNAVSVKGYQQYNVESLLAEPPDVYLVTSKEPQNAVLKELRADPKLSKLPCVQAGRIIVMDGDFLLRPGPRLFQGVQKLRALAAKLSR